MRSLFHFACFIVFFPLSALAQDAPPTLDRTLPSPNTLSIPPADELENLPPMDAQALEEGEPIRLTPDGPTVVHLSRDAGTVIVGNPAHANVVLENPRMLMLMPGQPGATKIMALDREGKSILNRHVLVGSGRDDFMRINRVCALGREGCSAQSVYYCPDKCYETTVPAGEGNMTAGGAPSAGPAPLPGPADVTPEAVAE